MSLYDDLLSRKEKLSVTGLGYVGMPIAVAFAEKVPVIGFDISQEKIALYQSGKDPTKEAGDEVIRRTSVQFTSDEARLREAKFHIVPSSAPTGRGTR